MKLAGAYGMYGKSLYIEKYLIFKIPTSQNHSFPIYIALGMLKFGVHDLWGTIQKRYIGFFEILKI